MTTPIPPYQQRERWSAAAAAYDKVTMPVTALYAADALRLAGLEPGQRVLDAAVGSGTLSLEVVAQGAQVMDTDFFRGHDRASAWQDCGPGPLRHRGRGHGRPDTQSA